MSATHPIHGALSALDRAPVWLNSEPLTAEGLRGRVVLVDFWTYSCVNWLRTLPYVSAWHERYGDRGLVVVGVHAPEFGFEHDLENVRRATSELGVGYPVVIDNDFTIWRSFENHYWPAVYLVDRDGRLQFHHFGEGAYEETERAIQRLLSVDGETVRVDAAGIAEAADWDTLRSPETYVGYARGERRRSDQRADGLALNEWALAGEWSVGKEAAVLEAAAGSIAYRFQARDLNLVLAPPASGAPVRFAVRLDGQPPGDARGLDVDESGEGTVSEPRMYQLVRQRGPSASAPLRSRSSTWACARTSSPSADATRPFDSRVHYCCMSGCGWSGARAARNGQRASVSSLSQCANTAVPSITSVRSKTTWSVTTFVTTSIPSNVSYASRSLDAKDVLVRSGRIGHSRVTRLRAWSGITGRRFESSSAHTGKSP